MPKHKQLHRFEAKSADMRISRDQPMVARLNFSLANGEVLVVEVSPPQTSGSHSLIFRPFIARWNSGAEQHLGELQ